MKTKQIVGIVSVILFAGFAQFAQAGTLSDNFDDGNANGWLAASPSSSYGVGNWRVDGQQVAQDLGGDHYKFLLNNYPLSSQSVEARVFFSGPSGYGGVTVWYQDSDNWVDVYQYPAAGTTSLQVIEKANGVDQVYFYPFDSRERTWDTLRVDANSLTGELKVYSDGTYLFTHTASTTHRTGLSGLNSGNAGGAFDDFKVTSNDLPSPPPANACSSSRAPAGYTLRNGTTGNDNVTLAPNTMFVGKGGKDKVTGGDGFYIVCTGTGDDTITLGNGDVTIDAGGGTNIIKTGNGNGYITTGTGNDTITTGTGAHTINAGGGNNTIATGDGVQNVTTGTGNDKVTTGSGNDIINASGGNNTVKSGAGTDIITTSTGNDNIDGGPDADICNAGGGTNTVVNCP